MSIKKGDLTQETETRFVYLNDFYGEINMPTPNPSNDTPPTDSIKDSATEKPVQPLSPSLLRSPLAARWLAEHNKNRTTEQRKKSEDNLTEETATTVTDPSQLSLNTPNRLC